MRKTQKLRLDKVDGIFEPAFVVPANISEDGYIFSGTQAKTEMQKAIFYAPPLQFLCRDGYGNMDFQEQLLKNTVRTDTCVLKKKCTGTRTDVFTAADKLTKKRSTK